MAGDRALDRAQRARRVVDRLGDHCGVRPGSHRVWRPPTRGSGAAADRRGTDRQPAPPRPGPPDAAAAAGRSTGRCLCDRRGDAAVESALFPLRGGGAAAAQAQAGALPGRRPRMRYVIALGALHHRAAAACVQQ
ncbi:hypothetical protein XHV734_4843 [Xanthomonas hortorum pv. vitians]|nr:hypothetical protein XHV734_4843 [Xanthomonas hortorum pv. vitians]